MRRSKSLRFYDFSGGLNTRATVTSLNYNEAMDLQNFNLIGPPGRAKLDKRRGNTAFNSSAMASGAAVHGLGYYRQADQDEWLMAITGTAIFKSEFDGTMDDITGAVSITAGQDNTWTHSVMNDLSIWVGGAPDAPIKWSGAGNAAALGGSPPSGSFGLTANNRFFIGSTTANPSRIAWSILGNPEDWSAAGSGTQDVSTNDGDTLVGAALHGVDHLLCFKQNSVHDLVIRNAPFPLFPLFRNVGAVSKRGIVSVDGITYFITPQPRMKATDGARIIDFPDTIDDVWDSLVRSRLKHIHGIYYPAKRQILWFCSTSSATTHDYCIIWDLERKCWLRHPTGYKMNVSVIAQDNVLYAAAYDGKIYRQDVTATFTDASETSPGAINAYWKSGWYDMEQMINSKTIPYVDLNIKTQSAGTMDFGVVYNFASSPTTQSFSMQGPGSVWGAFVWGNGTWGGQTDISRLGHYKGTGKFVQFFIRNRNASEALTFNGFEVPVRVGSPVVFNSGG